MERTAAGELGNPTAPRAAGRGRAPKPRRGAEVPLGRNGAVRGLAIRRDRAERSL
nr:MAG TPA: hypothetical protein [Caudoviricetes sp.]DAS64158.1 MAG TPA: hypothetical protein [Caudoviricetes sp.]